MGRILIVDDERDILEVLKDILEDAGHDVTIAENGQKALELASKEKFDIILTDIIMPEKEGISMILELKAKNDELSIIAMSGGGYAGPAFYLETAEGFGADRTLVKPITRAELLEAIDSLLN